MLGTPSSLYASLMSLIAATRITAIATAILAGFAIVTAIFAFLAFRKQSAEVTTLQRQLEDQKDLNEKQTPVLVLQAKELQESLDERKREAAARRRGQASRVFIWEEGTTDDIGEPATLTAHVKNTSDQPIYDLITSWHLGSAPHVRYERAKPLMPGAEDSDDEQPMPAGANPYEFGAVAFFRDAAGVTWRARPGGRTR